ncbi:hypothetical protein [uncultured Ferrimonas sp.]|uniref:multiheme c-type cytochrome n=1 Tax=uncultured Ferrimonas sp. TaxID=432640 RepID=UPI002637DEEE|nr:hypothetical protein [uncultured Ferrimonas sp.]
MTHSKNAWRLTALAAMMATALTGCGGSGSDGDAGQPGRPGGDPAAEIAQLNLEITEVKQVDGQPQLTVLATNEDDESVVGLTEIKVYQYQLYPQGYSESGSSARWSMNGSANDIADNGNGYYTVSFAGIDQNTDLTQRYNVMSAAGTLADGNTSVPRQEATFDFDHAGNPALYTKNVVSHDACAACHVEGEALTRRHSSFAEVETCVSCHNETRMDGQRPSFQHMVHNIHNANQSFTDKKGNEYTGVAAEHLIQNDCRSCHIADDNLSEWGNWNRVPTKETCSSCHNVGYDEDKHTLYTNHMTEQSNSDCAACHTPAKITADHISAKVLADEAADSLATTLSLTTSANGDVTATIGLVDASGADVDATELSASMDFLEVVGNLNPKATQLSYEDKAKLEKHGNEIAELIVDGDLVVQFDGLLSDGAANETALVIAGLRLCAEGGAFVACSDSTEYVSIDSAAGTVAMDGVTVQQRHYDSIDSSSCFNCHGDNFQVHNSGKEVSHHAGYTFNDNMQVGDCAACHNTQGTYASGANQGAIEMKLHSAHSAAEAEFIVAGDCTKCHTSFNVDAFNSKTALATNFELFSTPWAATCSSCHSFEKALGNITVQEHMEGAGGAIINQDFDTVEPAQHLESCRNCHDAEKLTTAHNVKF